ncbi:unnamed protein product [Prunus brigantina]
MAKLFAPVYLLLALFVFTSVRRMMPMVNADECTLATIGGGCPDIDECALTCSTCYRNVGRTRFTVNLLAELIHVFVPWPMVPLATLLAHQSARTGLDLFLLLPISPQINL